MLITFVYLYKLKQTKKQIMEIIFVKEKRFLYENKITIALYIFGKRYGDYSNLIFRIKLFTYNKL